MSIFIWSIFLGVFLRASALRVLGGSLRRSRKMDWPSSYNLCCHYSSADVVVKQEYRSIELYRQRSARTNKDSADETSGEPSTSISSICRIPTDGCLSQIQFHPYNYAKQKSIVEYATKHGIVIEGYSPLTCVTAPLSHLHFYMPSVKIRPITKTPGGPVDTVIARVAKRIGGNPGQVLLKWVRSKGVVVVTTSSKKRRLQEYLAAEDLREFPCLLFLVAM